MEKKLTVLMMIVNADSEYSRLVTEAEMGDVSKLSETWLENYKNTNLGYGFHTFVIDENGQRILVSAWNPDAIYSATEGAICTRENWANQLGEALAICVNASTAISVDNIQVWTGLGECPADTSTDAYEALVG